MAAIALRAAAWYLPADVIAVTDLPELPALAESERETCLALGIDHVLADPDLDAVELAARATRQALAQAGLSPAELDALIVIESRTPQTFLTSEPTRLQQLLGADRAMSFAVGGLGCASVAPGLLAARGLLCADRDMANVLVVHGCKPATPHRYRHPVTVNGDCGQALVVSRDGPVRILDILVETSGRYWDLFRVDYRDRPCARWREECTDVSRYSFELAFETRNRLRELHRRILDRNGLQSGDISYYLSQNLSAGAFRFYEEALGVTVARACVDNLRRYGHLGPNDVLLNLYTAIGSVPPADFGRAVIFNVSPSASWSAMLLAGSESTARQAHFL
ncbi:MAG: ketoacyl-ACP synthase III family protein [Pseudonocardiaceae bacterium]